MANENNDDMIRQKQVFAYVMYCIYNPVLHILESWVFVNFSAISPLWEIDVTVTYQRAPHSMICLECSIEWEHSFLQTFNALRGESAGTFTTILGILASVKLTVRRTFCLQT